MGGEEAGGIRIRDPRSRGGFEHGRVNYTGGSGGMEQREATRYANKRFNYSTRRAEESRLFDSLKLPPDYPPSRAMCYPRAESGRFFLKKKNNRRIFA